MTQKSKKTIGLGILSWNAHDTLRKSLDSYPAEFLSFFDQTMIYFSDLSNDDKIIANEYGWNYAGGPNEGIAGGMKRLAENMNTDYILLLQNDNPLCESVNFSCDHIQQAVDMMDDDIVTYSSFNDVLYDLGISKKESENIFNILYKM